MTKKTKQKKTLRQKSVDLQRKLLREFGVVDQHNDTLKVKMARRMADEAWGAIPHEKDEEVITWDPMGFRTGKPISLYPDIYESVKPGLKAFDQALENGVRGVGLHLAYNEGLEKAEKEGTQQKILYPIAARTGSSWNIPVYAIPKVTVVTPGILPISTIIPRVTSNSDLVQTTPLTSIGAAAHIASNATTFTEADDTYGGGTMSDYKFTTHGIGRQNDVADLMKLVGDAIANPNQTTFNAQLTAIRRFEEIQLIQGTDGTGSGSASSFKGLYDLATGTGGTSTDKSGGVTYPDVLTDLIENSVDNGANPETMAVVCNTAEHKKIKLALQDYYRGRNPWMNYEVLDSGQDFKWRVLHYDGIPIFKSYGCTQGDIYAFDFATFYMAEVQPPMAEILGRSGPMDRLATSCWETSVSEGFAHVTRYYDIPA